MENGVVTLSSLWIDPDGSQIGTVVECRTSGMPCPENPPEFRLRASVTFRRFRSVALSVVRIHIPYSQLYYLRRSNTCNPPWSNFLPTTISHTQQSAHFLHSSQTSPSSASLRVLYQFPYKSLRHPGYIYWICSRRTDLAMINLAFTIVYINKTCKPPTKMKMLCGFLSRPR